MDKHVLEALAKRLDWEAEPPYVEDGSENAALENARQAGIREGKTQCAHKLRMLIALLSTDSD